MNVSRPAIWRNVLPLQRRIVLLVVLVLLVLAVTSARAAEALKVYRVGITAFRDKSVTVREWQPTMDFLSAKVPGARFVAVPMTVSEFESALGRNELDFVLTNPQHYIILETVYGVSRVATLVKSENGKFVNQFGGVIFARSDRHDIQRLEDLKGKRIAAVDRTSFAAFLLQYDLLRQHGVDIESDSEVRFLGFPQDLCVQAVLDGQADVGFTRTGLLEAMAREGKIELARLRVISPARFSDFPFLITTGLFPEWPLAAVPRVPIDVTNQVVAALLLMPPGGPAAQSARYYRWSTPLEYKSVESVMRRHRVYPYDKQEHISPMDVVREYALQIFVGLFLAAAGLAVLYWRTRQLNIALRASRQTLSEMAHRDALTGLPNRNLLDDRLALALAHARRTGARVAVCLTDLDGFKPINDSLGHTVGDAVLRDVARHLEAALREEDTVARWGGDEFVLLINGFTDTAQLEDIMKRMLAAVAQSTCFSGGFPVSASIGVSVYPVDASTALGLFKHADDAMYDAKKRGGNRYTLHALPSAVAQLPC
ncbi:diguanylate cyclase [Zoogloea sp.]|uniref:diguanylate cyclase domain-containing protein n=1 Tax=Zoogloea sp. TaxID=49181 RepID=UPI00258CF8B0|nr:diguanylate cyclase [Zoogloea sp.]MDD2668965.1 diguanylate cyclase [Zoogloea sp.]